MKPPTEMNTGILNVRTCFVAFAAAIALLLLQSLAAHAVILLNEDFSSGSIPSGWSTAAVQGTDSWVIRSSPAFSSTSGSYYAVFDDQILGAGITPSEALLNTPSVNCSGHTSVYLRIEHHWQEVENTHGTIEVSTDGGTVWLALMDYELGSRGSLAVPQDTTFDITSMAANQGDVRIRFRYDDGGQAGRYWYLDDIVVFSEGDVGITDMTIPAHLGCANTYTTAETVTVEVTNFGYNPIANVPVVVDVTGGATVTLNGILVGPLAGGASITLTLAGSVNMVADAVYDFNCYTNLAGDVYSANDNYYTSRQQLVTTYPYLQDFNGTEGGWWANGGNSARQFAHGALPYLDGPEGEGDSWFCNANGTNTSIWIYVESPVFDLSGMTDPQLFMDVKHGLHYQDYFQVQYSTNGGNNWYQLGNTQSDWYNTNSWWRNSYTNPVDDWDRVHINLCGLAGQSCVKFRARGRPYYGTQYGQPYPYFSFDNVGISEGPDVGVMAYIDPVDVGCLFATDQQVTVSITNFSCTPISNVPIQCDVTEVLTTTLSGTVPGPIPAGGSVNYTFPTTFDMTVLGTYNFSTETLVAGDIYSSNNSRSTSIDVTLLKVTSYPYLEDFNSGPAYWTATGGGGTRSFVLGALPYLNGPDGEGDSWHCSATGNSGSWIYLTSPVFDFSNLTRPTLSFDIKHGLHNQDYFQVEYSTNGGTNWTRLGTAPEPTWYNTSQWWRNSYASPVSSWTGMEQQLCFLSGEPCVIFRIKGRPYYGEQYGQPYSNFAIDNFQVDAGEPDDLEVAEIVLTDAGDCNNFSSNEPVAVVIRNNTCRPLYDVQINLQVDGGGVISEMMPGPIPGYGYYHYGLTATADLSSTGTHTISATTVYATDNVPGNDNLVQTRYSGIPINSFPYMEDFNADNGGWVSRNTYPTPTRIFRHGTIPYLDGPEGEGDCWYSDANGANSGNWVYVESPAFDLTGLTDPQLSMQVKHGLHQQDYFQVQYSTNGGVSWYQLGSTEAGWYNTTSWWRNSYANPVDDWTSVHINLCGLVGQSCVKFRVRGRPYYGTQYGQPYPYFAFDNVQITDGPDIGIMTYIDPVDVGCLFATDQQVTVTVQNFGCNPVSNIPIQCTITGPAGATLVGTVPGPIASGVSVNYTFPTSFNMTGIGTYDFSTQTSLAGDVFPSNDLLTTTIHVNLLKVTSYPYMEDFNSGPAYWTASGGGGTRSFVHGAVPYLNGPDGQGGGWYCSATGNSGSWIYLTSPVFDFSTLTNPTLSFDIKYGLHFQDYFQMEYSINGGANWTRLGSAPEPTWYNSTNYWRGNYTNPVSTWTSMGQQLCSLSGEPCVIFRIKGRPYYGEQYGQPYSNFAIDNFQIDSGGPDDIEPTEIVLSDAGDCGNFSSTEPVAVVIRNYTCRPIYNAQVNLQVDGGGVITETVLGPIPRFGYYRYDFTATADLSSTGTHVISITTVLATDNVPGNDNRQQNRYSGIPISSFPYSEDFNTDNGGWVSSPGSDTYPKRIFRHDSLPYLNGSEGEGNSWYCDALGFNDGSWVYVESPMFNMSSLTSPELAFDIKHGLHNQNYFQVQYSTNGGSSWAQLGFTEPDWYNASSWWRNSYSSPVDAWTRVHINLCSLAGQGCVKFRIRGRPYYGTQYGQPYSYFAFDNFELHESVDVGITAHLSPLDQGCLFADQEQITVRVYNYISNGCTPIYNIPVSVEVSGMLNTILTGIVPGPIPIGGSVDYTFSTSIDMTPIGTYDFSSYTQQVGDLNPDNDTLAHSITVSQVTVTSFPYVQGFNSGAAYWETYGGGGTRSFNLGTVPYLNGPEGQGDSWYCTATGNSGSWIYLESPVFDLTGVANPRMFFDLKHGLHYQDYFQVQYSVNGGVNWYQLGSTEPNWYNTTSWWRGSYTNPVDEWTPVQKDLCSLAGESCVKFRLRGRPYYGEQYGQPYSNFAMDNFRITDTQVDAELVSVTGCWGSQYGMDVTIRNLDNMCITPATITAINVSYRLDADPVVTTVYSGLSIGPNSTYTFTVPGITIPSQSSTITVWVDAPNGLYDHVFDNDTLIADLSTWPQCNDHCSNSIELGFGTTTASQTSNATVDAAEDPTFAGCGPITVENTVWYHFTTNALGGAVQLDFHGLSCSPSNNGIQVSMLEISGGPCDPLNYTEVYCASPQNINDFTFGPQVLPPNTTYYIAIDGFAGNDCDFQITIAGSVTSTTVDPPTTSDHTTCTDPVDLTASGSTGNYRWYDQLIGGTLLSTSDPYTVNPAVTTTYYVCAVDGSNTESNRIPSTVTVITTTYPRVWNGNIDGDWNVSGNWSCGGVPDNTVDVLIPTAPSGGVFPIVNIINAAADNIEIETGAALTMNSGGAITVRGTLTNNGTVNVNDGGSLVQEVGSPLVGNGTFNVLRQGGSGSQFNFWSSPITSQPSAPGTSYSYDPNTGTQDDSDDANDPGWYSFNGTMQPGSGYAVVGGGLTTFTGTANNGNISVPLVHYTFDNTYSNTSPGTPFNLIGNPYPCPISAASLIAANSDIDGTIYFWDDDNSGGSDYHRTDFAYWNGVGGLGTGSGSAGAPNGNIGTAQGFYVRALNGASSLTFSNAQRLADVNTQFFRPNGEDSRLWFSVEKDSLFNEVLIGVLEDATEAEDRLYDAVKMHTVNSLSLAAMGNSMEHAIMAFPPPAVSNTVPLLVSVGENGVYTFTANTMEGFAGLEVYFNDMQTNVNVLLEEGTAIDVQLQVGEYADRFFLNFSSPLITGIDQEDGRGLYAYAANLRLYVLLNDLQTMNASLNLYDMSGRNVLSVPRLSFTNGVPSASLSGLASGTYVARITSDHEAFSQKIILEK